VYHTYILENLSGRFYIGHTNDIERRLAQHNSANKHSHLRKYTHKNGPWTLVWAEQQPTRSAAMNREKLIKSWKSAKIIRKRLLIQR